MPQPELTLGARYIFPIDGPPIHEGCVRILGDKIRYVGPSDRQADMHFGNAAIVAGFVNAHTHLELSNIRAKSVTSDSFTGWLRKLIEARNAQTPLEVERAMQRGVDASVAAGTTLIGDVSSAGQSWRPLQRSALRATVFCELLGLTQSRALETATAARRWLAEVGAQPHEAESTDSELNGSPVVLDAESNTQLDSLPDQFTKPLTGRLVPSLSPHAPYSTHGAIYELAVRWSRVAGVPVCSHLAETREERVFLETGGGPFGDFLKQIQAWNPAWKALGQSPLDYISTGLPARCDWLVIHGNYLTDDEIARLVQYSADRRISVVYCPRTHNYFGHTGHPFRKLIAAGVNVCLGTDSLASNSSLSVLDELRYLRRRYADLAGDLLLSLGTLCGARALGREKTCGSLAVGKVADMAVVRLPNRDVADPHELLLDSDEPVVRTMIDGRMVFRTAQ